MTTTTKKTEKKRVRLLGLRVRDFNGIELVEAKFDGKGGLVPIAGKNGQGKTSLMEAFAWGFGGPRAVPQTSTPIRNGAKSTEVIATTDAFTLERRGTPSGNRFVVYAPDGAEQKMSQAALDAMFSTLTFDPEAFGRMRPQEQRDALVRALGLEGPIADIKARHDAAYAERTIVGRKHRELEMIHKAAPVPDMFDDPEERSASAIVAEIGEARERANVRRNAESRAEGMRDSLQQTRGRITALEAELVLERERETVFGRRVDEQVAYIATLLPVGDIAALEAKLAGVEENNNRARAAKDWRKTKNELAEVGRTLQALQETIDGTKAAQESLVAGATLPVDGLRIEDEGLSLRGVPLGQASSRERIGVGFAVALAQDAGLRVCLIRSGSLLDAEAQAEVDRLARENDLLVLAEMVADRPSGAADEIWIEAGRVGA